MPRDEPAAEASRRNSWGERSSSRRFLALAIAAGSMLPAIASTGHADHPGAVLVLGASGAGTSSVVDTYGSGFIVRMDHDRNAAHVLTTRSALGEASRFWILYDPLTLPIDIFFQLSDAVATGRVPEPVARALGDRGHPVPERLRAGSSHPIGDGNARAVIFSLESFVLSGGGHEYLAIPRTEQLDVYHLLPATRTHADDSLDLAALIVHRFPHHEQSPVLFLDDMDTTSIGTEVVTSGCACGPAFGLGHTEVPVSLSARRGEFLEYTSKLVGPAFGGGAVRRGDRVIAINQSPSAGSVGGVRARLASTFKHVVDEWIGLPRMQVDLRIESPEGATDGAVSTDQAFVVNASARLDPTGQVLAPAARVELALPDSFSTADRANATLEPGHMHSWTVVAPSEVTPAQLLRLKTHASTGRIGHEVVADVWVETEQGATLEGRLHQELFSGNVVNVDDEIVVTLGFRSTGASLPSPAGEVAIRTHRAFEVVDADTTRPIDPRRPITWKLRARGAAPEAEIWFEPRGLGRDRNGKPIVVRVPEPLRMTVDRGWRTRLQIGLGRLGSGQNGVELEPGLRFRIANVLRRGVPLFVGFSVGFGVDHLSFEMIDVAAGTDEVLILDYRYGASVGTGIAFGANEVSVELGHLSIDRTINTALGEEWVQGLDRPTRNGVYWQPGVERVFDGVFGLYLGARLSPEDLEGNVVFLQGRFRGEM